MFSYFILQVFIHENNCSYNWLILFYIRLHIDVFMQNFFLNAVLYIKAVSKCESKEKITIITTLTITAIIINRFCTKSFITDFINDNV